jgi:hypothetical protein
MIIPDSAAGRVDEFRIALEGSGTQTFLEVNGRKHPFNVPFSRDEVESALDDYSPNRVTTDPLVSFGATLFSAVFSGELGRELWERLAEVESSNRGLRLRIESNLERTQHLPWELLFDPSRRDFMSLSGRVALVRTRPENFDRDSNPEPLDRLRILVVEANPMGSMRTAQDIELVHRLAQNGLHQVQVVTSATPDALATALEGQHYDVFHFAGIGEVLPVVSKRGGVRQALRLMGWDSEASRVDRQDLGSMLKASGVRLAVLNASHTDWVARSLAKYIPAAIGYREAVTDEACLLASETFYRSTLSGTSLDLAVTATRQAMDRARPGTGEWCKLIFYLQQRDGTFLRQDASPWSSMAQSQASLAHLDKEIVKLARLLDVYERNLGVLTRLAGSKATQEQVQDLSEKIDAVKVRLSNAPQNATQDLLQKTEVLRQRLETVKAR